MKIVFALMFILVFVLGSVFAQEKQHLIWVNRHQDGYTLDFTSLSIENLCIFKVNEKWYFVFNEIIPFQIAGKADLDPLIKSARIVPFETLRHPTPHKLTVVEVVFAHGILPQIQKESGKLSLKLEHLSQVVPFHFRRPEEGKKMDKNGQYIGIEGRRYYIVTSQEINKVKLFPQETDDYRFLESIYGFACELRSPAFAPSKVELYTGSLQNYFQGEKSIDWVLTHNAHHGKSENLKDFLNEAWDHLMLAQGPEASGLLMYLPSVYPGIETDTYYKLILGMAFFFNDQYEKALKNWESVPHTREVVFLKSLASFLAKKELFYSGIFDEAVEILEQYTPSVCEFVLEKVLKVFAFYQNHVMLSKMITTYKKKVGPRLEAIFAFYNFLITYQASIFEEARALLKNVESPEVLRLLPPDLYQQVKYLSAELAAKPPKGQVFKDISYLLPSSATGYAALQTAAIRFKENGDYIEMLECYKEMLNKHRVRATLERTDLKIRNEISYFFNSEFRNKSPLRVIALYEMYKDHIPQTRESEGIMKKVVETFLALDLKDLAATMLTKMAMKAETNEQKNDILLSASEILIQDEDDNSALVILDDLENLTPRQEEMFKKLRSLALIRTKRSIEALELVEGSEKIDDVKKSIEIYKKNSRWQEAGQKLLKLYGLVSKNDDPKALRPILSDLAFVYSMAQDSDGLKDIKHGLGIPDGVDPLFDYLISQKNPFSEKTRQGVEDYLKKSSGLVKAVKKKMGMDA